MLPDAVHTAADCQAFIVTQRDKALAERAA